MKKLLIGIGIVILIIIVIVVIRTISSSEKKEIIKEVPTPPIAFPTISSDISVDLKPKQGNSKGQVFIATGYGLEGVLPDAIVNSTVIDYEMIPYFKENNYYQGLSSGIKVIMEITRGEYTAQYYQQQRAQNKGGGAIPAIIIFIIVFIIMMRGRRNRFYSPGKSLPFWLAMGMLSGGRGSGGSFGNFSSGSGGFGGFGGGSFGGGGAGGSW